MMVITRRKAHAARCYYNQFLAYLRRNRNSLQKPAQNAWQKVVTQA